MSKTVINIKADKEVKENAQKLAQELGLSLSDVMNAALRNFIRTRETTFSSIPHMTPELERLLGNVEKDVKEKKNISGSFSTAKEVNAYLDSL
jgi:addiction module RelB/DinJ family antitoxin